MSTRNRSLESSIIASETKLLLLDYQNDGASFSVSDFMMKQFLDISDYRVKKFDKLSAIETIFLIQKEVGAISSKSCLIFCIFANIKNDGYDCHDRTIVFRELVRAVEASDDESVKKRPIIFMVNDFESKSDVNSHNHFTRLSNIFILVNYTKDFKELNIPNINLNIILDHISNAVLNVQEYPEKMDTDESDQIEPPDSLKLAKTLYSLSYNTENLNKGQILMESSSAKTYEKLERKCLILKYDCNWQNVRKLPKVDSYVDTLTNAFNMFGFDIETYLNLNYKDIIKLLNNQPPADLFAICLFTYCENDTFYCSDKKVSFKTIIKILNDLASLHSKPKLFFVLNSHHNKYSDFDPKEVYYTLLHDRIKLPKNFALFYTNLVKEIEENDQNIFKNINPVEILSALTASTLMSPHFTIVHLLGQILAVTSKIMSSYNEKEELKIHLKSIAKNIQKYDLETGIHIELLKNLFAYQSNSHESLDQNVFFKSTLQKPIFLKKVPKKMHDNNACQKDTIMQTDFILNKFQEDQSQLHYPISTKGGICFILKFQDSKCKSTIDLNDVSVLKSAFQNLNFKKIIEIQNDNNKENNLERFVTELLLEVAINSQFECFAFLFIANYSIIKVVKKLLEQFNEIPDTIGKPKLILVFDQNGNALRNCEPNNFSGDIITRDTPVTMVEDSLLFCIPQLEYLQGISILSHIFDDHFKNTDFITMLNMAIYRMLSKVDEFKNKIESTNIDKKKKISYVFISTLTRLLYFSPISQTNSIKNNSEEEIVMKKKEIIFFINQFAHKNENDDIERLKLTFEKLNFTVSMHTNLNSSNVISELHKISKHDYSELDCVALFIVAETDDNETFYCQDGHYINTGDIIQSLSNNVSLEGKPKLFFIQTIERDTRNERKQICNNSIHLFMRSDIFQLRYSSVAGLPSLQSCFTNSLCNVFSAVHEKYDLMTMISFIMNQVKSQTERMGEFKCNQIHVQSTIRNIIYLK